MNYYLVDFENVKNRGLAGIEELARTDKVIIFYSDKVNTITFEVHGRIMDSKADILYKKVYVGSKNALDFQLASYLGYLIRENEGLGAVYNIVTADQGYRFLKDFWVAGGEKVYICKDLKARKESAAAKTAPSKTEPAESSGLTRTASGELIYTDESQVLAKLDEMLPEKGCAATVWEILQSSSTKQEVNNALMKRFPGEKNRRAARFYKAIKPLLVNL